MNRPRSKSSTADLIGSRLFRGKKHFRVVLLGSTGVGKTCIVSRLLYEKFVQQHKATIEELHSGIFEINGVDVTLELLDTSGSFEFPAMRRLSIMTGDGFMLVFAMNDKSSFDKINDLKKEIFEVKGDPMTPIVVIGNKSDLCLQLTFQDVSSSSSSSSDDEDDDNDESKVGVHFRRYSVDDHQDESLVTGSRKMSHRSVKDFSSSSDCCSDERCRDDGGLISINQNQEPQRRGSIFNNGNSALEKYLQERSMREDKYGARKMSNVIGARFGKVEAKFQTRRKCSEGRNFAPHMDVTFTTRLTLLQQQQQQSPEINPLKNPPEQKLQDHHHHQQHFSQKYQRRKSHQANYQRLETPRHSLPLHHLFQQQPQQQQHQQHSIHYNINKRNQNLHHDRNHHQQQQSEIKMVSRRNPSNAELKVAKNMASSDWQHGFIKISAKNDPDVSTAIFKALLSEVDIHLQELQCLPPKNSSALDRLFHFRSRRRVSEDTKMRYRRNSCKVS